MSRRSTSSDRVLANRGKHSKSSHSTRKTDKSSKEKKDSPTITDVIATAVGMPIPQVTKSPSLTYDSHPLWTADRKKYLFTETYSRMNLFLHSEESQMYYLDGSCQDQNHESGCNIMSEAMNHAFDVLKGVASKKESEFFYVFVRCQQFRGAVNSPSSGPLGVVLYMIQELAKQLNIDGNRLSEIWRNESQKLNYTMKRKKGKKEKASPFKGALALLHGIVREWWDEFLGSYLVIFIEETEFLKAWKNEMADLVAFLLECMRDIPIGLKAVVSGSITVLEEANDCPLWKLPEGIWAEIKDRVDGSEEKDGSSKNCCTKRFLRSLKWCSEKGMNPSFDNNPWEPDWPSLSLQQARDWVTSAESA